ncbi:MAG: extracellular solute-binding protein [Rhodovibrionaceae bacterium]
MIRLQGMTWDHRRATEPLYALDAVFRELRPDVEIAWKARPLSGFEFDSIERLAAENDMIVFDHPFCGRIAASGCLLSLGTLVEAAGGAAAFVGPSVASYRYGGGDWALPIDAACQVAAYRPDLLAKLSAELPATWDEVCGLAERAAGQGLSLAIGLRGVHSLMTFFSLSANLGAPFGAGDQAGFDAVTAKEVLGQLRRLVATCRAPVLDWNSIELQDALSSAQDLVYCPAVYGFGAYGEADRAHPLAFGPFPGLDPARPEKGSTIGGAGLGLSARLAERPEAAAAALDYARLAASQRAQREIFPAHHGQPAHVSAWSDPAVDGRFNGFFSATLDTIEGSWVRPRYDGYLAFQERAGGMIESHLRGDLAETALLEALKKLDLECRVSGAAAR